jgi:formylglycine-generating enzyme required for sulfatase activity
MRAVPVVFALLAGCQLLAGLDDALPAPTPENGAAAPPSEFRSCEDLPKNCDGDKDCCASSLVRGGDFNRTPDASWPATISDFRLDVYEVTVGRFRKFVEAGQGTRAHPPENGVAAHPKNASSGWNSADSEHLEADSTALARAISPVVEAGLAHCTWTKDPGENETRPINCVTWYEAFAFCAWDGGRLPTLAEASYAAAGGAEQRALPWGGGIDPARAAYECRGDGSGAYDCSNADILRVGSKPAGNGKWSQADLAGNVAEWVLDYAGDFPLPCVDCAGTLHPAAERVHRGGAFDQDADVLGSLESSRRVPSARYDGIGVRCARSR